jgi:hypothetical protein
MKSLAIIAALAAACASMSAQAQDWAGVPLAPSQINGTLGLYGGYGVTPTSTTTKWVATCRDPTGINYPHPAPCAPGEPPLYQQDTATTTIITTLPAGAVAPGSTVSIGVGGFYPDSTATAGFSRVSASITLTEFARVLTSDITGQVSGLSEQVTSLRGQLAAMASSQATIMEQQHRDILENQRGIALASSLNIMSPSDGRSNRLAIGLGAYRGQSATSINYTRRTGNIDVTVAAAFSGSKALAKAGAGFSW